MRFVTSLAGEGSLQFGSRETMCMFKIQLLVLYPAPDRPLFRLETWVSLKIIMAETPQPSEELRILQDLSQKRARYIVKLLDSFIHQGPNGSHQCLVFELLGPSVDFVVYDYHMGGDRLDAATILRISRQLLKAIASIHAAGYAHGGLSGSRYSYDIVSVHT